MVCQRLALIMGFVSVRLRKWHARVHWCLRALLCVCVQGREHRGVEKKMYIHAGDYILKRERLVCAFKCFHTTRYAVFSFCSCSAK